MKKRGLILGILGVLLSLVGCALNDPNGLSKNEQLVDVTLKTVVLTKATTTVPAYLTVTVNVKNSSTKPVLGVRFTLKSVNVTIPFDSAIASLAVNANRDLVIRTDTPAGGNTTGDRAEVFFAGYGAHKAALTVKGITFA